MTKKGLEYIATFSKQGINPFDEINWEKRKASITDDKHNIIFQQEGVEVPSSWSMLATNVMASKYLYGDISLGTDPKNGGRESSAKQLVYRVSKTVSDWGLRDGYFASEESANTFQNELSWLLINQYGAFNSPVWFNVGLHQQYGIGGNSEGNFFFDRKDGQVKRASSQYEYPQGSACFIQSVQDNMDDIMELARSEAMLFKYGSGSGTDLSTLRSTREKLSGGGKPSGPLSFLKVYDQVASVIKSGGKTRRAAKMNTLKVWHPDIKEFIEAKQNEERKAWALIEQGYDGSFNGEAYGSVMFQNENLSVRVTDEFMKAVEEDKDWTTHWVTDPSKPGPTYKARELLMKIAEGTWICGDPGVQYEDTIQKWHTSKNSGPINSSNPCSEYMYLDNTACNLASLNLMKFLEEDGNFNVEKFKKAVEVFITAQEIIVDNASYPTQEIARQSHIHRTLGLGYANLGSLLMSQGIPYDSQQGRALAGAITSIMHQHAYVQSSKIAEIVGPAEGYKENAQPIKTVLEMHRQATKEKLDKRKMPSKLEYLVDSANKTAEEMIASAEKNGVRNMQVTVLAPTGTIGFLMDCDTTGVEPDIALVKYKLLAGGGMLKIVNQTVKKGLEKLGYSKSQIENITNYIDQKDTIEGAPELKPEHLSVFDCAFKPRNGERFISYTAHVDMMAAVQPFLSGAISKTVNMPNEATPKQIFETYVDGWKKGLKALAIYRDGSKRSQPVSTGKREENIQSTKSLEDLTEEELKDLIYRQPEEKRDKILRRKLPPTRNSITHKFEIAGHEGYVTFGLYENKQPGEVFITMAKEGSTVGGLMDSFGTSLSLNLQYGIPVKKLVEKFAHTRFEPSGFTKNPDIQIAKSIPDYIVRLMGNLFLEDGKTKQVIEESQEPIQVNGITESKKQELKDEKKTASQATQQVITNQSDAPPCDNCGSITVRSGACYKCANCGNSMGCS